MQSDGLWEKERGGQREKRETRLPLTPVEVTTDSHLRASMTQQNMKKHTVQEQEALRN